MSVLLPDECVVFEALDQRKRDAKKQRRKRAFVKSAKARAEKVKQINERIQRLAVRKGGV